MELGLTNKKFCEQGANHNMNIYNQIATLFGEHFKLKYTAALRKIMKCQSPGVNIL